MIRFIAGRKKTTRKKTGNLQIKSLITFLKDWQTEWQVKHRFDKTVSEKFLIWSHSVFLLAEKLPSVLKIDPEF